MELKCKHCEAVFPADHEHECSYDKLKLDNQRMKEALNTICYTLPATNPQAWHMKEFAKKGLYGN